MARCYDIALGFMTTLFVVMMPTLSLAYNPFRPQFPILTPAIRDSGCPSILSSAAYASILFSRLEYSSYMTSHYTFMSTVCALPAATSPPYHLLLPSVLPGE